MNLLNRGVHVPRSINYSNRGKPLENKIDRSNQVYKRRGWAIVNKVPTPFGMDRKGRIFYKDKSIVDYVGISQGKSIAFDAKSTNSRTSFPLNNIKDHQLEYLKNHQDQGGLSFMVVEFAKLQETYFLTMDQLMEWWLNMREGGRKSIPHVYFKFNCDLITSNNGVILDYLKFCETVK